MNYLNVNDFKSFKDFWILEGEKINVVFSNAKMGKEVLIDIQKME